MDADVLQLIPETAVKIFIPQISFRGYAPYKDVRFTNRNYGIQLFGIVRYPFLYRMHMVNSMIIKGKTNEQIIAELKREDYFSEAEIKSNLEEAFRILQVMDAKADVPIFDFIRENYQKELLFKDCIHANDVVLFEYARRLSSYLGEQLTEEINEVEETCKRTGAYFQVASEEPVLPCVAKVLELNFATPDRLYMEKITEERIRMRTLEEWFGDYCDYFRAVLVVKHTLNPEYKSRKVTIYRPEEEKYSMERETEQW